MKRFAWFLFLLAACDETAAPAPPLVSPDWLREHRSEVVLLDVQSRKELYEKGHLKGAVWVDFEQFRTGKKQLAAADVLAKRLGELGIDENTWVVVYDEKHGRNCGYAWYVLKQLGHERMSILDGHMDAFASELETGPAPAVAAKTYRPRRTPQVVSSAWVKERLGKVPMLDARPVEQYTGEKPKEGMKGGHLPGAVCVPWDAFTGKDGRYLDETASRAALAKLAGRELGEDEEIVVYCNSYHQAAHVHWVLDRLGYKDIKAFDASMKEWEELDWPRTTGEKP
jgi:thiosulfate/3-mercaptopyruvate sulfurtransferase